MRNILVTSAIVFLSACGSTGAEEEAAPIETLIEPGKWSVTAISYTRPGDWNEEEQRDDVCITPEMAAAPRIAMFNAELGNLRSLTCRDPAESWAGGQISYAMQCETHRGEADNLTVTMNGMYGRTMITTENTVMLSNTGRLEANRIGDC